MTQPIGAGGRSSSCGQRSSPHYTGCCAKVDARPDVAQDVLKSAPEQMESEDGVRILDPLERTTEILFGVIMVLTFTSSISVAQGGQAETREVLVAALGCNVAWGIVDGAFYLMASFVQRARALNMLRAIRDSPDQLFSHGLILTALPSPVSAVLTPTEVESLRLRLRQSAPPTRSMLARRDFVGALGVFLLVFLSTLPIVLPFLVIPDAGVAMRTSNAIAIAMLFGCGWSLGAHTGRPGWRSGALMVGVGLVLVAMTIALGG
jgi:VIT1/CCC1 family predicted Fe2+/Mn2+ transporter